MVAVTVGQYVVVRYGHRGGKQVARVESLTPTALVVRKYARSVERWTGRVRVARSDVLGTTAPMSGHDAPEAFDARMRVLGQKERDRREALRKQHESEAPDVIAAESNRTCVRCPKCNEWMSRCYYRAYDMHDCRGCGYRCRSLNG